MSNKQIAVLPMSWQLPVCKGLILFLFYTYLFTPKLINIVTILKITTIAFRQFHILPIYVINSYLQNLLYLNHQFTFELIRQINFCGYNFWTATLHNGAHMDHQQYTENILIKCFLNTTWKIKCVAMSNINLFSMTLTLWRREIVVTIHIVICSWFTNFYQ